MALAGPLFTKFGNWNLLLFFVVGVGALVLLGVPIAFSFGLATFGYIALTTTTPTVVVVGLMDEGMSHLILLTVPLFVLLGLLIDEMTGIARASRLHRFPAVPAQVCVHANCGTSREPFQWSAAFRSRCHREHSTSRCVESWLSQLVSDEELLSVRKLDQAASPGLVGSRQEYPVP